MEGLWLLIGFVVVVLVILLKVTQKFYAKRFKKKFNLSDEVYEYKRTCNRCGKVWYSLAEREHKIAERMAKLKSDETCGNLCNGCAGGCGSAAANMQTETDRAASCMTLGCCGSKHSSYSSPTIQTIDNDNEVYSHESELERLRRCPECQSSNYLEETLFSDNFNEGNATSDESNKK